MIWRTFFSEREFLVFPHCVESTAKIMSLQNCQNGIFWQFHVQIWMFEKFSSILYTVLWKHIAYVDWLSLNAFLLAKFASSIDCSPDLALPLELKIIDKAASTTITIKMVLRTILPFALALSISELLKNKISHKWIVF